MRPKPSIRFEAEIYLDSPGDNDSTAKAVLTAAERAILLPILTRKKSPTNSTYHHGLYLIGEGYAKVAAKSRRRQVAYTLR
jgi:hypothetical protein